MVSSTSLLLVLDGFYTRLAIRSHSRKLCLNLRDEEDVSAIVVVSNDVIPCFTPQRSYQDLSYLINRTNIDFDSWSSSTHEAIEG